MSRIESSITLVCYDITNNKLRGKIDKIMKDFGVRIQYSVFLCCLSAEGVSRCRSKLNDTINKFSNYKNIGDSLVIFEGVSAERINCVVGKEKENVQQRFRIY